MSTRGFPGSRISSCPGIKVVDEILQSVMVYAQMKQKNKKPEVVTGSVDSNGIPWIAPMSKEHPEPAWLREHKAEAAPAQSGQHTPGPQQALRELIEAAKSWGYGNTEVVQNAKSALKISNLQSRSIAAAPELLEACKSASEGFCPEVLRQIRAAIAKAEGRE